MKRQPTRSLSPISTAGFSGVSNYRTDDFRPVSTRNREGATVVPNIDYREVFKIHYGELGRYLVDYLTSVPPNSRSGARSRLARLRVDQLHELSTDVYDELVRRRRNNREVLFLPVREEFHPRRNKARQKLATRPTSRFQNLCGDLHWELARRYPEFREDPSVKVLTTSNNVVYPCRTSEPRDHLFDTVYGGSVSRRPSGSGGSYGVPLIEDSDSELDDQLATEGRSVQSAIFYPAKKIEEKAVPILGSPFVAPWAMANPEDLTGMVVREGVYPAHGGGYADIYRGTLRKKGLTIKVAVKMIRAYTFKDADQWKISKRLRKEIRLWSCLRHPNIVPLLGTTTSFGLHVAMVCPWMTEGNLNNYLSIQKPELNLRRRLDILTDVVEGLSYLHAQSIIHGDLTTANILMDNGKARLTDFGLSNVVAQFRTISFVSSNVAGAARWAAPELYDLSKGSKMIPEMTRRCDIYSFGSVALQVISGRIPYEDIGQDFFVLIELMNGIHPSRPPEPLLSNAFWNFIVLCWKCRPKIDMVKELLLGLRHSCSEQALAANVIGADKR